MKRTLLAFVGSVVLLWVAFALIVSNREQSAAFREWPAGLGRIASVPQRFPRSPSNAPALGLARLADDVSIHFDRRGDNAPEHELIGTYVRTQLQRPDAIVEAPPAGVSAFLAAHRDSLDVLRKHLLTAPDPRWEIDVSGGMQGPLPNLVAHMQLHRLFLTSAFDRARAGDPAAWDDLRASWKVATALESRPELISALIRLAIMRNVTVAARKMPLPVPEWFGEVRAFDARMAMLAAMQSETLIAQSVDRQAAGYPAGSNPLERLTNPVMRPYIRLTGTDMLATMRQSSAHLYKVTDCGFDVEAFGRSRVASASWWNPMARISTSSIFGSWSRVYRFEVDRELTDRALALRAGETPSASSRCTDGNWVITAEGLKFSKALKSPGPATAALPLEFKR